MKVKDLQPGDHIRVERMKLEFIGCKDFFGEFVTVAIYDENDEEQEYTDNDYFYMGCEAVVDDLLVS